MPFEVAMENVRASMAKRATALARIRTIREEGGAGVAARKAVMEARLDGSGAEPEAGARHTPRPATASRPWAHL